MYGTTCEAYQMMQAGRLLAASIAIAVAVLVQALLQTSGFDPLYGAVVLSASGLGGGWLLNSRAPVPGLPLVAALAVASATMAAAFLGLPASTSGGATLFVALLLAGTARSWSVGLVVTGILVAAELLSRIF